MGQKDFRVTLPRVQRIRRGDRVLSYHRPTGTRLPDLPETHPDFVAAWAMAEAKGRPMPVKAGTVEAVVRLALTSRRYRESAPVYQATLRRGFDAIRTEYGDLPVGGLRKRHVAANLAPLAPNPANARLKAWRLLCAVAMEADLIEDDPSAAVAKVPVRTEGHARWTDAEVTAFRAKWPIGTSARACFELVLWTGARTNDAVAIGPQHVGPDGVLVYRQSKTRNPAYVPWTSPLPDYAAAWAVERTEMHRALQCLAGGLTFLQTASGRARSVKGLGNVINDGAREAGIEGCTAHGLRKTRLSRIAEGGGSAHALMAWGGHKTLAEVQRYTLSASMKRLVSGTEQDRNAVNDRHMAVNGSKS